jgi:hypothetical protein
MKSGASSMNERQAGGTNPLQVERLLYVAVF